MEWEKPVTTLGRAVLQAGFPSLHGTGEALLPPQPLLSLCICLALQGLFLCVRFVFETEFNYVALWLSWN